MSEHSDFFSLYPSLRSVIDKARTSDSSWDDQFLQDLQKSREEFHEESQKESNEATDAQLRLKLLCQSWNYSIKPQLPKLQAALWTVYLEYPVSNLEEVREFLKENLPAGRQISLTLNARVKRLVLYLGEFLGDSLPEKWQECFQQIRGNRQFHSCQALTVQFEPGGTPLEQIFR